MLYGVARHLVHILDLPSSIAPRHSADSGQRFDRAAQIAQVDVNLGIINGCSRIVENIGEFKFRQPQH
jgi:hypothetical protein